jgi:predicted small secreted protein
MKTGIILCVLAMAALAGCNTINGMGKDIKSGGQAIENAASAASKKM